MTQSLSRRHPKVVSLKINAENVVVSWSSRHRDFDRLAIAVTHQHFGLVGVESRAIYRPIRAVVISQTFVSGEPGTIAINCLDLIEEVAGQAAVFRQKVVPVAAVVAAG